MEVGLVYNSFAHVSMLPEEKELRDTGLAIGKHLERLGHTIRYFDMDNPEDIKALCHSNIQIAFDTCERVHRDARGESYVAALLEYLGIYHTRTSAFHIALGINKVRVKMILSSQGIATPRFQVFTNEEDILRSDLHFPLFVKGVASENSIGIDERSLVTNLWQLKEKVSNILATLHQPALVEEFIEGREFAVAILPGKVNRTLPILEMEFDELPPDQRYLDYAAKWVVDSNKYRKTKSVRPHYLSKEEIEIISDTALRSFKILGLDSYARVDMRMKEDTVYVLEVNQNPSIGEDGSGYVRTAMDSGLDYTAVIDALLQNALLGMP